MVVLASVAVGFASIEPLAYFGAGHGKVGDAGRFPRRAGCGRCERGETGSEGREPEEMQVRETTNFGEEGVVRGADSLTDLSVVPDNPVVVDGGSSLEDGRDIVAVFTQLVDPTRIDELDGLRVPVEYPEPFFGSGDLVSDLEGVGDNLILAELLRFRDVPVGSTQRRVESVKADGLPKENRFPELARELGELRREEKFVVGEVDVDTVLRLELRDLDQ